jgi:hypothetical protein
MRKPRVLPAAFVLSLCSGLAGQSSPDAAPATTSIAPVSVSLSAAGPLVQQYDQHLTTLANPFFEGRAPGLRGNRLAADYIEFQFDRLGLTPAFTDPERGGAPTFRQPFDVGSTVVVTDRQAAFTAGGAEEALTPLTDFSISEYSGAGEASGPVAFVGYSIDQGPEAYTTYPPLDESNELLKGKIALVLRFEPMNDEGKSKWIDEGWSFAASLIGKIQAAADRGAAGIIIVTPANAADPRAGQISDAEGSRSFGGSLEIPVVMLTPAAADRLVRAADSDGRSLADLQKLADASGSVIDLPNATARIAAGLDKKPVLTDNVGAVLAGKGDLADQYIIVGGHYDHVGYGQFGSLSGESRVHPGADDNASGTSGVLLLADLLSQDYAALPEGAAARSVLFLCFSAEEMGLIGSRHYVEHPSVPVDKSALMLNMDMIGRLRDDHLEVGGVGTGEGLEAFVNPFFAASGLTISPSSVGDGRSDHASFHSVGIPALFFFTGLHDDYHQPGDVSWKINREGAVRVVELVRGIAMASAQRRELMAYTEPVSRAGGGRPPRVMLGIQPTDTDDPAGGVTIAVVTPGSAAEEAGLKAGDRLTSIAGTPLPGAEQLRPILRDHDPGEAVEIVYVRDGQEMTTTATLKARGG